MKWLFLVKNRLSFGSAGMAEGIIDCGLTYFVLIYYSQVLGLPATLASNK
jgi:Na+/melibiose symporter-like transporter